jgi:hypothetical protein
MACKAGLMSLKPVRLESALGVVTLVWLETQALKTAATSTHANRRNTAPLMSP